LILGLCETVPSVGLVPARRRPAVPVAVQNIVAGDVMKVIV
jgi:hypothetical protein